MARSTGKPGTNPLDSRDPDRKEKVPSIDDLMRRPQIPDGLRIFPPPVTPENPFGPVPILPRSPPVPTWPYGPPYLGERPAPIPSFGAPYYAFPSPQTSAAAGGLPGMIQRLGALGPSNQQDPPAGGLVGLIQEYLRNHRARNEQRGLVYAAPVAMIDRHAHPSSE